MKSFLLSLTLVLSLPVFSQTNVVDPNKNLVVFCGYNFNEVVNQFNTFLEKNYNYTAGDAQSIGGKIVITSIKKVSSNGAADKILQTWSVDTAGIITGCKIEGNRQAVANLFLNYWPTGVTVEIIKQKPEVVSYLLTDKVIYSSTGKRATLQIQKANTDK